MVILKKTWPELAPSILAASNKEVSMPIMPDIRRIVVLPNHIMKFMMQMSARVQSTLAKKRMGSRVIPTFIKMLFIGPPSENKVKNSIANAAAMIRFGI